MDFKILKKSKKSQARLGVLKTAHSEVETPALVPVATQATIKTLSSEEVLATNAQLLICNTFHLHLKPGEGVIKKAGGLHKFMNWSRPLMTDSGGFQVFSLGFGRDLGVGKVMKYFPGPQRLVVKKTAQPSQVRIAYDGVYFKSPIDGRQIFIGPRESMAIQAALGADIAFAFDECTPPLCDKEYASEALARTHRWAKICFQNKPDRQALFGIVQGSQFRDLREQSAKFINSLGFDGFGIGGDLGESRVSTNKILQWTLPHLEAGRPRHMLGIGYLEDVEMMVRQGIDTFDCTVPTHYARHGIAFMTGGKIDLRKTIFLADNAPIDKKCCCSTCLGYRRNYIAHLFRASEITGAKLATIHNLHFFNKFVERIREKIKQGRL